MSTALGSSTLLRTAHVQRETFDPSDGRHIESFRTFLETGNWGEIQFHVEAPYTDVPMTVLMKFAQYTEGVSRETEAARCWRISRRENTVPFPKPQTNAQVRADRASALAVSNEVLARLNAQA